MSVVTAAEVRFLLDKFDVLYEIRPVGYSAYPGPVEPVSVVLLHMASRRDADRFIECNGHSDDYAARYYPAEDGGHIVAVLL